MIGIESVQALEKLAAELLAVAPTELDKERIQRAHVYAWRRLLFGEISTVAEARVVFAAFGDGFCTGFHRGEGSTCPHQKEIPRAPAADAADPRS